MFDRVPMQVIQKTFQVVLITAGVFPKSALPNRSFTMAQPRKTARPFRAACFQIRPGKDFLDLLPTNRVIIIAWGQDPNGVKMIRQEDNCENFERALELFLANCLAKTLTAQFVA